MFAVSTKGIGCACEGDHLAVIVEKMASHYFINDRQIELITDVYNPETGCEFPDSVNVMNEQIRNRYDEFMDERELTAWEIEANRADDMRKEY